MSLPFPNRPGEAVSWNKFGFPFLDFDELMEAHEKSSNLYHPDGNGAVERVINRTDHGANAFDGCQ